MSLPASYAGILNELNRDVLRARPTDPLQFCANWFNSKLEEQRKSFLNANPSAAATNSVGGHANLNSGSNAPGNASPTQTSLFNPDPFSQQGQQAQGGAPQVSWQRSSSYSDQPGSASISREQSETGDSEDASGLSATNNGGLSPAPFIPAAFNLGRRTSVSAESLAPSANPNDESAPLPKTVIPKSEEMMQRIQNAIGNNLLFRNLEQDQYRDVLLAMKEVKVDSGKAVIEQGAQGDYFYVVESGTLDVYVRPVSSSASTQSSDDGSGPSSSLATLGDKKVSYGPGSSFGELALLYAQPRAATVLSTSPCTLWALDRVTFRSILMETNSRRRAMYERFLKDVSLFEHLSAAERAKISDSLEPRAYNVGERVITQGERGTEFFIIVEGNAEVKKKSPTRDGVEETVGKLHKGDYFGELALLNNAPRAASIVACQPDEGDSKQLRVVTLSERAFTRLLGPLAGIMGRHAKEHYGTSSASAAGGAEAETVGGGISFNNSFDSVGPSPGIQGNRGMDTFAPGPRESNAMPGQGAWLGTNPFAAQ
ncbi:camp-dependent protein kinase regulatory chain [Violaceomyces palustris]|uniref:Camp-dependent protein kinase regulatory chain n=1 Tax=Violaceomyces palustris TaxID=1673888 RepID=A0ACD0P1W9_9BASI|nr:camp-dependent protein kinase regulatory chain [Violaceomyces palustris]